MQRNPPDLRNCSMLRVYFSILSICIAMASSATHIFNYTYDYKVVGRDSSRNQIEFNIHVLTDCANGAPGVINSDLMLGIFKLSDNSKAAELQLPKVYYNDNLPLRDSLPGRPCIANVTYSNTIWLDRAVGNGYIVQISSCCYGAQFTNILAPDAVDAFNEFRIPEGIDSGFQSPRVKDVALFVPPAYKSAWFDFSEDPGSFDSVRYAISPIYTNPSAGNINPWDVPNSRVFPTAVPFKSGFDQNHPLGSHLQYQVNDSGTLFSSKIITFGIYQVAVWSNHYRNGKKYPALRYITVIPTFSNQPQIVLAASAPDAEFNLLQFRINDFDNFIDAEIFRIDDSSSTALSLANILPTDTIYYDSSVVGGNTYRYYIRGINGPDTIYSLLRTVKTPLPVPRIILSGKLESPIIQLNWIPKDIPSPMVYHIYHGTHLDSLVALDFAGVYEYQHSPGKSNIWHYYQIRIFMTDTVVSNTVAVFYPNLTGMEEYQSNHFEVYPNPSKGHLSIKGEYTGQVLIRNSLGQKVYEADKREIELHLDISHFPRGIYILQVGHQSIKIEKTD